MSETRQIAGIVIVTLVLGIVGLILITVIPPLLQGNLVVDSYEATLYDNGTLHEQYIYNVHSSGESPDAVPLVGIAADI